MFTALNKKFWQWACFSWHLAKHWFTRQKETKIQQAQENQTPQQVHSYRLTPEKKKRCCKGRREGEMETAETAKTQTPVLLPGTRAHTCCPNPHRRAMLPPGGCGTCKDHRFKYVWFSKRGDKHIYQAPHDIQCRLSFLFLFLSKQVPPINNSIGQFLRCSDLDTGIWIQHLPSF